MPEASFMLKNGYLDSNDILGTSNYLDANGNLSEGIIINLKEIEIAGIKLLNVRASIVKNMKAPLLLGQTAISKLGNIQVNLQSNTITILNENATHDYQKKDEVIDTSARLENTLLSEDELNVLGRDGWELIQYIDGRHLFKRRC